MDQSGRVRADLERDSLAGHRVCRMTNVSTHSGRPGFAGRVAPGAAPRRHRRTVRAGAALLEVVVALSLLLISMAAIGVAFNNGSYFIEKAELLARADIMTERLIGQIETGIVSLDAPQTIGDFGEEGVPGMTFRVTVNPDQNVQDLLRVDIEVFMGHPEEDDDAELVTRTHLLRAMPRGIDFARDFGFDEEQLAQVTDAIPGGEAVLDVTNFDPKDLASLDLDMLVQMLPTLMQALGGNMAGGDLSGLLQAAASGDMSVIKQLQEGLQGAQQGGPPPQGGAPGGPPPGGPRGRGEADPDGRPERGPRPEFGGDGEGRPPRGAGGPGQGDPDGRGGEGRRGGGRRGGGQ